MPAGQLRTKHLWVALPPPHNIRCWLHVLPNRLEAKYSNAWRRLAKPLGDATQTKPLYHILRIPGVPMLHEFIRLVHGLFHVLGLMPIGP